MYPATAIQKQFWIAHQRRPDCPAHNVPSVFRVQGPLNLEAWKQSLQQVVATHEILRTHFKYAQNDLFVVVEPRRVIDVPVHSCQPDKWQEVVQNEISQPFFLTKGPLLRAMVLQLGPEDWVLVITHHHIIFDLRAKDMFAAELSANYKALVTGKTLPNASSVAQYSDYCTWQSEFMAGKEAEAMHLYWEKQLAGKREVLNLPADFPRPVVQSLLGGAVPFELSRDLTQQLKDFSRELESNFFLTLLAAYYLLLYRYSGQQDIIVGVPFTNRRHAEHKNIMGCFMNILPIGVTIDTETTFKQLLTQIRGCMLSAHRNQEAALETIVQRAGVSRDPSRNPLFQLGFTFEHPMAMELSGLAVKPIRSHPGGSQLDMFAVLDDTPEGLRGHLEYRDSIFSRETVEMFGANFKIGLQAVMENPNLPLGSLDILDPVIREKIEDKWNATAYDFQKPTNLKTLFENQAKKTPDNVAVAFNEDALTYGELNARTNRLAHYLQSCGVADGAAVGVYMDRSLEMVEAIYGIIKAGGAYVPLDPRYPQARLDTMVEEAQPLLILTHGNLAVEAAAFSVPLFSLDESRAKTGEFPESNLDQSPEANSPAYIIFTSGSSGKPKGVVNAHEGVCNRILWMQKEFNLNETERVLQKTPFGFDVSVWEFFWPLTVGACLVVAPPGSHRNPSELERIIAEQDITTLHFVPSMLQAFLDNASFHNCRHLKRVISSGEALSTALVERFHGACDAELVNLYGPTEAAVDVTCWHCKRDEKMSVVPIGKPIANTQMYILDQNLKSVLPGAHGELYIGGVQVALGYVNQPELTSFSFLPNPFNAQNKGFIYRTGDLCRYLPDGNIEYLGRLDSQVKIRGFRIELGEIEAAMAQHPSVAGAAVQVVDYGGIDVRLLAYAVPHGGLDLFSGSESQLAEWGAEVIESLKMLLPHYMVPSQLEWINEIPLGVSGKIDRKSLPVPEMVPLGAKADFASPETTMEKSLAEIWAKVLKVDRVGRDDSFFDLGGNSLLSIYLANKMHEELKREISVVLLFQYPTIKLLARFLEKGDDEGNLLDDAIDRAARRRLARGGRRRNRSQ